MSHSSEVNQVKRNTIISMLSLFFQSGYSAFLGLAANLVLTILLTPASFGIYTITLSMISVLNYFSDIGLAASLIQKKEISDDDVKTTFTLQQAMILTLITICFFITPYTKSFYKLPDEGIYLYWALLVSFFISSLKTIPSVFLEREIKFHKIVQVQIVENTIFYVSVMICAVLGMGLNSFTISVLLRAVIGLIMIYSISPWMPKIGISRASLKELLSFGVPFQASSFLALFKDDLIVLFLGKIIGPEGVAFVIGWAKKWAEASIRIVMDNISRVIFPLIARFKDDKEKVGQLMEKILYYQTALVAPAIVGAALIMGDMVYVIPKYEKWIPALPYFYMFCTSSLIVSIAAPFMNLFNALGKVKITFSFMLAWTIITWALTPILTTKFGLYGFPLTHLVVSLSYGVALWKAKQMIQVNITKSISPFLTSAGVMGATILAYQWFMPFNSLPFIVSSIVLGAVTYFACLHLLFEINLVTIVKSLKTKQFGT